MDLDCFQNFMRIRTFKQWNMLLKHVMKIFFFSKRLSCHLPGMVQDSSAWRQDYGLINLLALQLCQSQFSPRFQSDTAASSFILVGFRGAVCSCNFLYFRGEKRLQYVSVAVHEVMCMVYLSLPKGSA